MRAPLGRRKREKVQGLACWNAVYAAGTLNWSTFSTNAMSINASKVRHSLIEDKLSANQLRLPLHKQRRVVQP
jgi:hypothetical protein